MSIQVVRNEQRIVAFLRESNWYDLFHQSFRPECTLHLLVNKTPAVNDYILHLSGKPQPYLWFRINEPIRNVEAVNQVEARIVDLYDGGQLSYWSGGN